MTVKQVIVMRSDLGMRKGKMCAQAAHASMAFMTNKMGMSVYPGAAGLYDAGLTVTEEQLDWIEGTFTKICVSVDSEDQLMAIHDAAKAASLTVSLITDAGLTEFHGIPTRTCLAIGPHEADKIDPITGHLKLL